MESADQLLAGLDYQMPATSLARLARIHGPGGTDSRDELKRNRGYLTALAEIRAIAVQEGELPLYR
jgi:beta-N-acetylhexosaminidase